MMKYFFGSILAVIVLMFVSCSQVIETGNIGVRTSFGGQVNMTYVPAGWTTAVISDIDKYSAKEITVYISDMQPKAADNLKLADMDIEVYYQAMPASIPQLKVKYVGTDHFDDQNDVWLSAYNLVSSQAISEASDVVSRYESLEIHKFRDKLRDEIKSGLQARLDADDPGAFKITKVIIQKLLTDPTIEANIQAAVAKQQELEGQKEQTKIYEEQARSNDKLNASLTPEILRNKELDILKQCVENKCGDITILIGADKAQPFYTVK